MSNTPLPSVQDTWRVVETAFDPTRQHVAESLFTLSNGYLGTRGTFEEGYPGDWPATFIHGVYNDVSVGYTELANGTNWLPFDLLVEGEHFCLDRGEVLDYFRELNLRHGLLTRRVRWRSPAGRTVSISIERFASLADPHLSAIRYEIVPLDFDGWIEWHAGLDGHVETRGTLHWYVMGQGDCDAIVWIHSRTRDTGIEMSQAARLAVSVGTQAQTGTEQLINPVEYSYRDCKHQPKVIARVKARRGQSLVAEKIVSIFTTRDIRETRDAAIEK